MRTLAITENITLDGVIDAEGGWFDPSDTETDTDDERDVLRADMARADAFLVGRLTFEAMRSFWPNQIDDQTGVTDYLNSVHKYVVSTTLGDPEWAPTTVLSEDPVRAIRALKAQPGADIVVTGSITLTRTLIAAGLVDEYRLHVYPVVRGRGARLFEDAIAVPALRLVETQQFRSGVLRTVYTTR